MVSCMGKRGIQVFATRYVSCEVRDAAGQLKREFSQRVHRESLITIRELCPLDEYQLDRHVESIESMKRQPAWTPPAVAS